MITVAGLSPSHDLTYLVDRLELGQIHRPTEVVKVPGGKPLNLARAATIAGAEIGLVAVLGGAAGEAIYEGLEEAGIRVRVVLSPVETRTCVSIASAETGELTEIYEHATELPEDVWQTVVLGVRTELASAPTWLAIAGGSPRGLNPTAQAELVQLGHEAGVSVAIDLHSAALPAAVEAKPELVKVNRSEAAELLGVSAGTSLREMADAIQNRTGGMVVLTDGKDGALGLTADECISATSPDLEGNYPVGSGDSFLGGLLATLDSGGSFSDAMRMATACGVANALVPGPARFELSSALRVAGHVNLKRLSAPSP